MNGHGIPIGWGRGAACGVKSGASGLRRFDRQGAMEATRNGACSLLHLSTLARTLRIASYIWNSPIYVSKIGPV
jgi:hypothetical protein